MYRLYAIIVSVMTFVAVPSVAQELKEVPANLVDTVMVMKSYSLPDSMEIDSAYRRIDQMTTLSLTGNGNGALKGDGENAAREIKVWRPDPKKATWIALIIPGGGQIYNRKYWKLPIVYGGFVGCLYAYNWNGQMYKDYRQAYLDIMDSDPNTDSYKDFFRPGYDYESNKEYLKEVFKKRKDRYRRWRDLSIFAFIGVYAVSVIDAYVDAQLSSFDITEDINLTIEPQRINSGSEFMRQDYYGLNLNISF
ncbi:MAG: hypothetical protein IKJ97_09145 [Bacteroidaceae bacterium]|nr:hypothetical protein [Bacteroidaceae bacterium]